MLAVQTGYLIEYSMQCWMILGSMMKDSPFSTLRDFGLTGIYLFKLICHSLEWYSQTDIEAATAVVPALATDAT